MFNFSGMLLDQLNKKIAEYELRYGMNSMEFMNQDPKRYEGSLNSPKVLEFESWTLALMLQELLS